MLGSLAIFTTLLASASDQEKSKLEKAAEVFRRSFYLNNQEFFTESILDLELSLEQETEFYVAITRWLLQNASEGQPTESAFPRFRFWLSLFWSGRHRYFEANRGEFYRGAFRNKAVSFSPWTSELVQRYGHAELVLGVHSILDRSLPASVEVAATHPNQIQKTFTVKLKSERPVYESGRGSLKFKLITQVDLKKVLAAQHRDRPEYASEWCDLLDAAEASILESTLGKLGFIHENSDVQAIDDSKPWLISQESIWLFRAPS
jgi:hypothetical protein